MFLTDLAMDNKILDINNIKKKIGSNHKNNELTDNNIPFGMQSITSVNETDKTENIFFIQKLMHILFNHAIF